jgi:hypothetical protein
MLRYTLRTTSRLMSAIVISRRVGLWWLGNEATRRGVIGQAHLGWNTSLDHHPTPRPAFVAAHHSHHAGAIGAIGSSTPTSPPRSHARLCVCRITAGSSPRRRERRSEKARQGKARQALLMRTRAARVSSRSEPRRKVGERQGGWSSPDTRGVFSSEGSG